MMTLVAPIALVDRVPEKVPDRKTRESRKFNAPRGTRTPNLLIRSQTLYPIELWARISINLQVWIDA